MTKDELLHSTDQVIVQGESWQTGLDRSLDRLLACIEFGQPHEQQQATP